MNSTLQAPATRESYEMFNRFNKDYPIFEKKVNFLIQKNTKLKIYIYILLSVIFVLILVVFVNYVT